MPQKEIKEYDLSDGEAEWADCHYLNAQTAHVPNRSGGEGNDQSTETSLADALALWAIGYRNIPGQCLEANYFYRESRNYKDLLAQFDWFEANSIPSQAFLHFGLGDSASQRTRTASSLELVVRAGEFELGVLPEVVSNLKYRNTRQCVALINAMTGADLTWKDGEKDCLKPD